MGRDIVSVMVIGIAEWSTIGGGFIVSVVVIWALYSRYGGIVCICVVYACFIEKTRAVLEHKHTIKHTHIYIYTRVPRYRTSPRTPH